MINWLNKQLNEQMLGSHGKYSTIDAATATVNSLTNSNTSRIPSRLALVSLGFAHMSYATGLFELLHGTGLV